MNEKLIIKSVCKIRNNKIFLDEDLLFSLAKDNANPSVFMKNAYKHFKINYSKFFKMDNLSKLGFLAAEILINKSNVFSFSPEETGIVISNSSSSLDTDKTFNDTIKDSESYFPSPSVFVYTLPNILIGEICIRHEITGENTFFISEKFDPDLIYNYISDLFEYGKVQHCITGWVDFLSDKYDAVLYLIEKDKDERINSNIFNPENILQLYT
ncbi:MAG: hypothetical protein ABR968_02650 [Bacteroidales bacterium]|jgi:hypothetical protein